MSARATSWVQEHFPIVTSADRNRKIVLLCVAECCNSRGEYGHPGIEPIVSQWAFDRTTVMRHLKWLVTNGWLTVVEQGNGRGNATVFDITKMIAERVAHCDPLQNRKGRNPRRKGSQPDDETVAIAGALTTPSSGNTHELHSEHDNVLALEVVDSLRPSTAQLARAITQRVFETKRPKPATPFPGVLKIAKRLLEAGWAEGEIEAAMHRARTISTGWVEAELSKSKPRSRAVDTDRSSPEGRITI